MSEVSCSNPHRRFSQEALLGIKTPDAPAGFQSYWQQAYQNALFKKPTMSLKDSGRRVKNWKVMDVQYESTDQVMIGGWLLLPIDRPPARGFVVGHGYGGREEPDFHLPFADAAILFPCVRGISRSPAPPISPEPQWHVLHDIDKKDRYIIKGCVEDIWLAVSCMGQLFPYLMGKLGYLGISLGGGIGALAMACEKRVSRAHFNVPTFGDHRLRLRLPTEGSGKSVQTFFKSNPRLALKTLRYFDAANAAQLIDMPVHYALALKDHVVTPPGQFAIYNATPKNKRHLMVLKEGHSDYPEKARQDQALVSELAAFFEDLR
ncbi:acetylxylan esterase [Marinomonas mediterranea]|uniref:acetylxylan esterase n=1 Tax=Marinomonas mediterranea TaxID=119864 RepID=UPI00234B2889|nr:acetylxylan esterase [Marinomonas mediterranea]WCN11061.1 acetylxylan esterase [Marinomonas mediterranea]